MGISSQAKELLMEYAWPGNVRELKNIIERTVLLENEPLLLPEHLLPALSKGQNRQTDNTLVGLEIQYLEKSKKIIGEILEQTRGNITQAAKSLDLPVHTLRYTMKKLGLKTPMDV